jgi:ribosomal protein S18 acetylase RimI-like enzyme
MTPAAGAMSIERLTGSAVDAEAVVDPLLREYVPWAADRFAELGISFADRDAVIEEHHAAFRSELPNLLGTRGRLLVARLEGDPVGLGALKPVGAETAEIKRMYVRPVGRSRGVGRALLERLLADARAEGYHVARLETATFMTTAQALYRSLGFRDAAMFDGSEAAMSGLQSLTRYMELPLTKEIQVAK